MDESDISTASTGIWGKLRAIWVTYWPVPHPATRILPSSFCAPLTLDRPPCHARGVSARAPSRALSLRSLVGIAGLVVLAGSLVFVAWQARKAALDNAHVALESRLINRLHAADFLTNLRDRATAESLISLPSEPPDWRWTLDHDGLVIVSTYAEDLGRRPGAPRSEGIHSPMRIVETAEGRAYEVCMPTPGRFFEPDFPPPLPPPLGSPGDFFGDSHEYSCTLASVETGLEGSDVANLHFRFSVAIALGLLMLAIYVVGDGIRTNRLRASHAQRVHLQELGQLAGVLAHEIRTPLAALRGYAQLLEERTDASFSERGLVERMVEQTSRVARFVDDLVTFARPTPPRFVEFDLVTRIHRAIERAYARASEADVRLISECPERLLIRADPDHIDAVLDNLLNNAIQASPAGEVVTVIADSAGDEVVIDVRDRGPGVPLEERERIFEPFFTTRASGTGLGLAMALKSAREHDGSLRVIDSPGGLIIRVTLPRRGTP